MLVRRSTASKFSKSIRCLISAVAFTLTTTPVIAADLIDVLKLAIQNDATLKAAELSSEASLLAPRIARTVVYPSVDLDVHYTEREILEPVPNSGDESVGVVQLRQWILSPYLKSGINIAESQARDAENTLSIAEQNLYIKVVERYFDVLAARDNLETAESEVEALTEFFDLTEQRLVVGVVTQADLDDAKARLSLAKSSRIQAANAIESSRISLEEITGTSVEDLVPLSDEATLLDPQSNDVDWWVDQATENSPELELQREAVYRAEQQIDRSSAGSKPSVFFQATHEEPIGGSLKKDDATTTYSLVLTVPFLDGGLTKHETQQSRLLHRAEQRKLDALLASTKSRVLIAYLNTERSIQLVKALEDASRASESALKVRQSGLAIGVTTTLELLNAQRDRFAVIRDLHEARYAYFESLVRLKATAGILSLSDIQQLNGLLE